MALDYLVKRYASKVTLTYPLATLLACQSQSVNVGDDIVSTLSGRVDVLFDEVTTVAISQTPVEISSLDNPQYSMGYDTTDSNGNFSLGNISQGNYELIVKDVGSAYSLCSVVSSSDSSFLLYEVIPTKLTLLGYEACVLGYVTEIQVGDYDKVHDVRLGTTSKITRINLSVTGSEPNIERYVIGWEDYTTIEPGSSYEFLRYASEAADLDEYGRGTWTGEFSFEIEADSWHYTDGSNCQEFTDWAKDGEVKVYLDDTIIEPDENSNNAYAEYSITLTRDSFGPFIYEFDLVVDYNVNLEPC